MANALTIPVQRLGASAAAQYREHLLALPPEDAHVALPPADARSLHSEFLAERVAIYDFALKSHVETLRRVGLALAGGARGGR